MKSKTKDMAFDVDSLPDGTTILTKYPELKNIKSFSNYNGELEFGKVLKYVIILYSEDSFLNERPAPEMEERKRRAADIAGFSKNKEGKFNQSVIDKLFALTDDGVLDMIIGYLKFQNKFLWTEIITTEQLWWENIRLLSEGSTDIKTASSKTKIRKEIQELRKDLESMYQEFYKGFDDVEKEASNVKRRTTLESLVP